MKRWLLLSALLVMFSSWTFGQIVFEDFEGGADLSWAAPNGTYNGVVSNPDPDAVNGSADVGSYTKSDLTSYSLFWATGLSPIDLSEYNQFKLQVYSTVATSILLKLEGDGGQAVEKTQAITQTNQWVEYTFDLSPGLYFDNLTKIIIFFDPGTLASSDTYLFDNLVAHKAGIAYEDFEGGADLTWSGLNGTFDGVVANPEPNFINSSVDVGAYTNNPAFTYNFALADLGAPMDLSINNQFKVKIYAPAPTQVLFKLEGTGGQLELIKNIAVTNQWQEYTFDFSSLAANTGISKILIAFAPGVAGSADTYLFDDIQAFPKGPCSGAATIATMVDDFDCNRNATYLNGWDSLHVIPNPYVTAANNSHNVGAFFDQVGEPWGALVIDHENALDLSVNNNLRVKVWSAKAGTLKFKLEGGASGGVEIDKTIVDLNEWVTYTVDFSAQSAANHKRITFFFNAGVEPEAGDVYYIDDIEWIPAPALPALEDFEVGQGNLFWGPLNNNAVVHGSFSGGVANPNPVGGNTSAKVGCYTKGNSAFSTLFGILPAGFLLGSYPQLNMDVWAPPGSVDITMVLVSPTQGNKEVTRNIPATGEWVNMGFDFSDHVGITDFVAINILFDPGTTDQGKVFYFDNLAQGISTIDPCEGVTPIANIVDDFECQRNYTVFYGSEELEVVANPQLNTDNNSLKVGEYTDLANSPWSGLGFQSVQPIDISVFNQLSVQIWSPIAVPVMFKLQNGTGQATEIWSEISAPNTWEKFVIDFSAPLGSDYKEVVIFFDGGVSDPEEHTYYVDNVRWRRVSYNGCVDDHETTNNTISNWKYFANGHLEAEGYQFEIVDNPNPSGINTSAKVGKFVKASDGLSFAGMYADLDAPIDFKTNKTMRAKVHMDHIGNLGLKVEASQTGAPNIELSEPNTLVNEWEEITINFATADDDGQYQRLTFFIDFLIDPTGSDVTSYFDDIVIGDGQCGVVNTFEAPQVQYFRIAPNPAATFIRIENAELVENLLVLDATGRPVQQMRTYGEQDVVVDIANLPPGFYMLAGYNQVGALIANGKFSKQ